jgi:hypothetical protein
MTRALRILLWGADAFLALAQTVDRALTWGKKLSRKRKRSPQRGSSSR